MPLPSSEILIDIIDPALARHGCLVEDVKVVRAGTKSQITVLVDAVEDKQSPDLDQLELITEAVNDAIDTAEDTGAVDFGTQPYTLEVSTPGVTHPLSLPRHWKRNRGRLVQITELDGTRSVGRIGAVSEDGERVVIVATAQVGGKKGAKKKAPAAGEEGALRILELGRVKSAVVEVEFSTAPDSEVQLAGIDFDDAAVMRLED